MEFSKGDMKLLKGAAILFMLFLHLFCSKEVNGLYETFPVIHGAPLVYYLALFGDACVPIFCFISGYGLFTIMHKDTEPSWNKNMKRIWKLLLNYWIVLLLFVSIGFFAGKADSYPGSLLKFIENFLLLSNSYNGAWWFMQTYVILVLLAPFLIKLIAKSGLIPLLLFSGIIYLLSYVQRVKNVIDPGDSVILNLLMNAVVLVGTSLLPFLIGSVFAKEKIYSIIYQRFHGFAYKNALCLLGILSLVILHAFYQSMIIAPFTAIAFICFFSLLDKSALLEKALSYLGDHSTNLWLTHMFFYLTIFPELTFAPKYPVLIFGWLIILCLIASYVIKAIYNPILRMFERRPFVIRQVVRDVGRKAT